MKNRQLQTVLVAVLLVVCLAVQPAEGAYVDVVDALNPTGYWRMGETSGTTATDRAGSNNGTYGGTVTLGVTGVLSGDSDTAVDFGSEGGAVDIGPTADLLLTGDLSVSFWFNVDAKTGTNNPDSLFTLTADALDSGTAKLAELAVDKNGDLVYTHEYGSAGGSEETTTFSAGLIEDTWYNVTLIRDSSARDVYLYLEDTLLDTFSYTQQAEGYTAGTLAIASYTGTSLDGMMDEFAMFGSVLTSDDVSDIYTAGTVPEPATVLLLGLGSLIMLFKRQ